MLDDTELKLAQGTIFTVGKTDMHDAQISN